MTGNTFCNVAFQQTAIGLFERKGHLRVEHASARIRVAGIVHHLAERALIAERRRAIEKIPDSERNRGVPEPGVRSLRIPDIVGTDPAFFPGCIEVLIDVAARKSLRQRRAPWTV